MSIRVHPWLKKETKGDRERFSRSLGSYKKTSRTAEETSRAVYSLTGKWSKFVEGLIVPSVEKLFKGRGIKADKLYQRVKTHRDGKKIEYGRN